jgi:hypothetical protein
MTNWGAAVPIIVAIIGISGVIVPPLINQIIKPNLNIDIGPGPKNDTETIIEITNSGTVPATNLSLIFTLPNQINNITNLFSTQCNISKSRISSLIIRSTSSREN